jgi:hypothetical protein
MREDSVVEAESVAKPGESCESVRLAKPAGAKAARVWRRIFSGLVAGLVRLRFRRSIEPVVPIGKPNRRSCFGSPSGYCGSQTVRDA